MKNEILETARRAVKNWWVSILVGILAIVLGIWCAVTPDTTLVALTIVFIVAFLISGIFEIVFAVSNRDMSGWGWSLAGGILDLILGILLMALPLPVITIVLVYFVGFWILIRSIWGIGTASDLSRWKVKGWGWMLALAILGVIAAFFFFISPVFGGGMIVWFAAFAFVFYGVFRIYLGIWLKSLKNHAGEVADRIEEFRNDMKR